MKEVKTEIDKREQNQNKVGIEGFIDIVNTAKKKIRLTKKPTKLFRRLKLRN